MPCAAATCRSWLAEIHIWGDKSADDSISKAQLTKLRSSSCLILYKSLGLLFLPHAILNVHATLYCSYVIGWKVARKTFHYQLTMLRSQPELFHQQNAHTPFRLQTSGMQMYQRNVCKLRPPMRITHLTQIKQTVTTTKMK